MGKQDILASGLQLNPTLCPACPPCMTQVKPLPALPGCWLPACRTRQEPHNLPRRQSSRSRMSNRRSDRSNSGSSKRRLQPGPSCSSWWRQRWPERQSEGCSSQGWRTLGTAAGCSRCLRWSGSAPWGSCTSCSARCSAEQAASAGLHLLLYISIGLISSCYCSSVLEICCTPCTNHSPS